MEGHLTPLHKWVSITAYISLFEMLGLKSWGIECMESVLENA